MSDTIIMIHGMWGSGDQWSNYRSFFEGKGFKVITPTLRHHEVGRADPALATTSLKDYVADLEKEIAAVEGEPIILGHSMGGLIAQLLCAKGHGKLGIFLTPAAPRGINALTMSGIKTFFRIMSTWGFWRKSTFPTFQEIYYSVYNLLPEEEAKKEYESLTYESGRATYEIGFSLIDSSRAAEVREANIKCPVLLVGAGKDRITPVSVVRSIARKYAAIGEYKEFPDHAHWVLGGERWEEVAEFCHNWIVKKTAKETK